MTRPGTDDPDSPEGHTGGGRSLPVSRVDRGRIGDGWDPGRVSCSDLTKTVLPNQNRVRTDLRFPALFTYTCRS